MKTIILYASTYGYTEEMVNKMIMESNAEFVAVNIVKNNNVDITKYDAVILGSSIYVGQIHKELKNYIKKYSNVLLTKKIGLFLSCGFESQFDTHLITNLGGRIQKEKLNFAHKILVNMIEKTPEGMKPVLMYQSRTLDLINQFYRA